MDEVNLTPTQITLIVGGIVLVLSSVLMFYYRRSRALLDEMWAVDTYDAAELRRMCSGGFRATVEVEGEVTCDHPISAVASKLPCAWCRTRVDREVVTHTKNGTRKSWRTDYDHTITTLFKVNDKSGFVLVEPLNATIDTEDPYTFITEEREPWFTLEIGYAERYRIREEIFVPTGYVYVLGQASNCQGGPSSDVLIHCPDEGYTDPKRRFFIISRQPERYLTDRNEKSLKVCFWGSIFGFMFAAYCALSALGLAR